MNPPLLVMIVGILSPIAQQLLFVLLKRRSSAHLPLFRLRPRNEWTYKLKAILYDGPQVGSVAIRLLWITGDPTEIQIIGLTHRLSWESTTLPVFLYKRFLINASAGGNPWRAIAVQIFTCLNVFGLLFNTFHTLRPFSLISKKYWKHYLHNIHNIWKGYMSQMLYADQSSREIVTFLSDF